MKKVIIIGGGLAGLSAGIYLQKNNFETTIIEKHSILGGECTGWYRKGNYIDGCIHWLMGTKKGTEMRKVWDEIGALDDENILAVDNFTTFISSEGTITIWRDIKRFKSELLEKAPEDKKKINEFISYIKRAQRLEVPAKKRISDRNIFELIHFGIPLLPVVKAHHQAGKYSLGEYSEHFKSPLLKHFFKSIFSVDHNLFSFCVALGSFMDGNADIPRGGSLDMSKRIENKYISLGGKVITNTEILKANIVENKIISLEARNSKKEISTISDFDYVIFACDLNNIYHQILDNKYNDQIFEERFRDKVKYPILSCCLASFSVDEDISNYPHSVMVEIDPFKIATKEIAKLSFRNYYYFKNKNGKTTVISMITQSGDDYDYWKDLYEKDTKRYHQEKDIILENVIENYLKLFPELSGKVEALDFTTPVTYNNYMNAYKGGYISFKKTKNTKWKSHHGAINGLENCLVSGQWTQVPGGAPPAVTSGKFSAYDLIKLDRKKRKK